MTARIAASAGRSKAMPVTAKNPRMMIGSCRAAKIAPTPSFHWKRNATYARISRKVKSTASAPFSASSWPTCGPTTSVRRSSTPGSALWIAVSTLWPSRLTSWFSCGRSRTRTSLAVPKLCTAAPPKPASSRSARTFSRSAACGKANSITTPPVKSMPKLSPRTASASSDPTIRMADTAYHRLRVAMNG